MCLGRENKGKKNRYIGIDNMELDCIGLYWTFYRSVKVFNLESE